MPDSKDETPYDALPGETAAQAADRIEADWKRKNQIRVSKWGGGLWVIKELEKRGLSVLGE